MLLFHVICVFVPSDNILADLADAHDHKMQILINIQKKRTWYIDQESMKLCHYTRFYLPGHQCIQNNYSVSQFAKKLQVV